MGGRVLAYTVRRGLLRDRDRVRLAGGLDRDRVRLAGGLDRDRVRLVVGLPLRERERLWEGERERLEDSCPPTLLRAHTRTRTRTRQGHHTQGWTQVRRVHNCVFPAFTNKEGRG